MKILFIYDGEYPWDIRVEKICNTFLRQNHEVHLICRNKSRKPRKEKYNSINIYRTVSLPEVFGKVNEIVTFPAFFSPIWLIEIYLRARKNKCDLIVVRDLPMALAAVWIGRVLKVPVILDMAECYPEMLKCIWEFEGVKFINIFLRNPCFAYIVEKKVMRKIDAVMVMVEEARNRMLQNGVEFKKLTIVSNTPEIDRFEVSSFEYNNKNKINLLYVGLLSVSRGVDVCIKAVKKYIEITRNDIIFTIVGTGGDLNRLKKMVSDFKIQDNVRFLGWIENKRVPYIISTSNICVVPHRICSHWNNTIPNKLFDYMASSKPVLVSSVLPMKRIVNETRSGLVYEDGDIDDFVAKLICLSDPKIRDEFGGNGKRAVVNKYNWRNEEFKIIELLNKLNGTYV